MLEPNDRKTCDAWIARYIAPSRYINHLHNETGIRMMMAEDTGIAVSRRDFRELMLDHGYPPASRSNREWEYRISPKPLRTRENAEPDGWLAKTLYRNTRRA